MRRDVALVGREAEMARLSTALDEAVSGRGRVALIGGEPGIGKSRLMAEVAAVGEQRGALVTWGRCWEGGGAPAFWPWVQAFRHVLREGHAPTPASPGRDSSDLAALLTELGEPVETSAARDGDPESARFRLFDSVTSVLRRVSEDLPIAILLDDLHAADTPSMLLLRFLARTIHSAPILIVGSYRTTEVDASDPLREAIADVQRAGTSDQLNLRGLAPHEVARLIESALDQPVSQRTALAVHRETAGNPLFVGEVARILGEGGGLDDPTKIRGIRVPQTILEALSRRFARLRPATVEQLTLASVLGREFDLDVVARLAEATPEQILQQLDEAMSAGLISVAPDRPGRLRFAHILITEALYARLPEARRLVLHQVAGHTLEELYTSDPEPHLAEIAHHFIEAAPIGEGPKAVDYAEAAGRRAVSQLAYEEAVRLFELAIRTSEPISSVDARRRAALRIALGDAYARAGELAVSKASFLQAAELARAASDPELVAEAALGYGGRFVWEASRDDPHLVPLLEDALSRIGEGDSVLRARLMARLAGGPMRDDPDRGPSDELSRRAVEMARRVGDPPTLTYALEGRYSAIWGPENVPEDLALATELVDTAARLGDRERELQAYHFRSLARLEIADIAGATADLEEEARLAEELRQPAQASYVIAERAMFATMQGRFDEAEELIVASFAQGVEANPAISLIYRTINHYALRRLQGRLSEVIGEIERVAARFPTYIVLRCILAEACLELGRTQQARGILEDLSVDGFASVPRNEEWIFGMCLVGEVAASLEDRARAELLLNELLPYAERVAISAPDACSGSVARVLGSLASALRRWDIADTMFDKALELEDRIGSEPWLAVSRTAYAMSLRTRGEPALGERPRAMLMQAFGTATRLRMEALLERINDLLEGTPATRVTRTFMFTDIVGSTALVEAIGDAAWQDLRRWLDETLRSLFSRHHGSEMDHAGDGFFVAFDAATGAIACAVEIQRTLHRHRREHGFAPSIRVGVHTAEATFESERYGGRGVHEAARIGALAEGGEILASSGTLASMDSIPVGAEREVTLRGISAPVRIVTVDWASEE